MSSNTDQASTSYSSLKRNNVSHQKYTPLAHIIAAIKSDDPDVCEKLSHDLMALFALRSRIMLVSKENFMLEKQIAQLDHRIQLLINSHVNSSVTLNSSSTSNNEKSANLPTMIKLPNSTRLALPYIVDPTVEVTRIQTPLGLAKSTKQLFEDLLYILQQRPLLLAHLTRITEPGFWGDLLIQHIILELFADQDDDNQERQLIELFSHGLKTEFKNHSDRTTLLRSNTTFTQMLSSFARRGKGIGVLKTVLGESVQSVCRPNVNFELSYDSCLKDSGESILTLTDQQLPTSRISGRLQFDQLPPSAKLLHETRRDDLLTHVDRMLNNIFASASLLPSGVRWVAKYLYYLTRSKFADDDDDFALNIVGGFVCLRYYNPCIVSPHSFELVQTPPDKQSRKNLIMVAKVIQNISNGNLFKEHEPHMMCFNDYITKMIPKMQVFLREVTLVEEISSSLNQYLANSYNDCTIITSVGNMVGLHWVLYNNFDKLCTNIKEYYEHPGKKRQSCMNNDPIISSPTTGLLSSRLSQISSGYAAKRMSFMYDSSEMAEIFNSSGDSDLEVNIEKYCEYLHEENEDDDHSLDMMEYSSDDANDDDEDDKYCDEPFSTDSPSGPSNIVNGIDVGKKLYLERQLQIALSNRDSISKTGLFELRIILALLGRPAAVCVDQLKIMKDRSVVLRPKNIFDKTDSKYFDNTDPVSQFSQSNFTPNLSHHSNNSLSRENSFGLPPSSSPEITPASSTMSYNDDFTPTPTPIPSPNILDYYTCLQCTCSRSAFNFVPSDIQPSEDILICTCTVALTPMLQFINQSTITPKDLSFQYDLGVYESLIYAKLVSTFQYTPSLHALSYQIAGLHKRKVQKFINTAPTIYEEDELPLVAPRHVPLSAPIPPTSTPLSTPTSSGSTAPLKDVNPAVLLSSTLPPSLLLRYIRLSVDWVREHVDPLFYTHIKSYECNNVPCTPSFVDSADSDDSDSEDEIIMKSASSAQGSESNLSRTNSHTRSTSDFNSTIALTSPITLPATSPYYSSIFPHRMPPSARVRETYLLLKFLASAKQTTSFVQIPVDISLWCRNQKKLRQVRHKDVKPRLPMKKCSMFNVSPSSSAKKSFYAYDSSASTSTTYIDPATSPSVSSVSNQSNPLHPHTSLDPSYFEHRSDSASLTVNVTQVNPRESMGSIPPPPPNYPYPSPSPSGRLSTPTLNINVSTPSTKSESGLTEPSTPLSILPIEDVLPTQHTQKHYRKLLRRSILATQADMDVVTESPMIEEPSSHAEMARVALKRHTDYTHKCDQRCIGVCASGLDDLMLDITPKTIRLQRNIKVLDRRVSEWICKWVGESVGGIRMKLCDQTNLKLKHVSTTIKIVLEHQTQLYDRQTLYDQYFMVCKQGGPHNGRKYDSRNAGLGSVLSSAMKNVFGVLVKNSMFHIGIKQSIEGGDVAKNALQNGHVKYMLSGEPYIFNGNINQIKCRTYKLSLLMRKGVVVCTNRELRDCNADIVICQVTPTEYMIYVTRPGAGIDRSWGGVIDLEELLSREEAAISNIEQQQYDTESSLSRIDLRRLRTNITKEECQLEGWQVYEDAVGGRGALSRMTIVGVDQVGRCVSILWVNELVIEVISLLDRVLRKHFIF